MRFWRNALRIGLPFGAVIAFLGVLAGSGFTGLALAVAVAALLQGGAGALVLWWSQQEYGPGRGSRAFWLGLLGVILGLASTSAFYHSGLSAGRWTKMSDPPCAVVEILGIGEYDDPIYTALHVSCDDGELYACADRASDWSSIEWLPGADYVPYLPTGRTWECSTDDCPMAIPRPPGKVADIYSIYDQGADGGAQVTWILLRDGSMWHTFRGFSATTSLGATLMIALSSALAGALQGWSVDDTA